ncbi:MAG TPA: hypothetical protein VKG23_11705 [Thermoanaerobaculia bacterium]|nr:hypothetical protein [Thermoanaerobaculia bacterium]
MADPWDLASPFFNEAANAGSKVFAQVFWEPKENLWVAAQGQVFAAVDRSQWREGHVYNILEGDLEDVALGGPLGDVIALTGPGEGGPEHKPLHLKFAYDAIKRTTTVFVKTVQPSLEAYTFENFSLVWPYTLLSEVDAPNYTRVWIAFYDLSFGLSYRQKSLYLQAVTIP